MFQLAPQQRQIFCVLSTPMFCWLKNRRTKRCYVQCFVWISKKKKKEKDQPKKIALTSITCVQRAVLYFVLQYFVLVYDYYDDIDWLLNLPYVFKKVTKPGHKTCLSPATDLVTPETILRLHKPYQHIFMFHSCYSVTFTMKMKAILSFSHDLTPTHNHLPISPSSFKSNSAYLSAKKKKKSRICQNN